MSKQLFTIDEVLKGASSEPMRQFIDAMVKSKTGFSPSESMSSLFKGPNISGHTGMIKPNTNNNGYIFTVRPDLNLATENISVERKLAPLLSDSDLSLMRAIRVLLSPRMAIRMSRYDTFKPKLISSKLVNPNYPFIAISDNLAKSLTGWPSGRLSIHAHEAGLLKEEHLQVDGPSTYSGQYSLNLSCHSMKGNPVMYLYYFWILYIGFVYYSTYGIMPWPEYLSNGRMDYTTRIYRFITDETRTFVTEFACTGYAIPQSVDIGQYFDYSSDTPRPFMDKTTEIEFACSGAIYLDEIVIRQFNQTVTMFNPFMHDKHRSKYYVKVDKIYQNFYNNQCYPRVNQITRELEWWVDINLWKNTKSYREAFVVNNYGYNYLTKKPSQ